MKQLIRSRVAILSSYVEIYISILILLIIAILSINLVKDIIITVKNVFSYSGPFNYELFLGDALKLIIGVEFVKMLAKHTPESAIEVLLFAIARKLIVDNSGNIDIIIGVAAIAILFAIKKFLYTPNLSDPYGFVVDATTSLREVNLIASINLSEKYGYNIGDVLVRELNRCGKEILEGSFIIIDNVKLKVYSMMQNEIDKVEVVPQKKKIK